MADRITDMKIALRWPKEWARANDSRLPNRSKARQQIRRRFAIAVDTESWRNLHPNAACQSCRHFEPVLNDPKRRMKCAILSDSEGFVIKTPSDWCTAHERIPE